MAFGIHDERGRENNPWQVYMPDQQIRTKLHQIIFLRMPAETTKSYTGILTNEQKITAILLRPCVLSYDSADQGAAESEKGA